MQGEEGGGQCLARPLGGVCREPEAVRETDTSWEPLLAPRHPAVTEMLVLSPFTLRRAHQLGQGHQSPKVCRSTWLQAVLRGD